MSRTRNTTTVTIPGRMPVVAIVGRPNVGKSTLFNRLAGKKLAIVMDTPGVTRDRNYVDVAWDRLHFTLVDTGGVDLEDTDPLGRDVGSQSLRTLSHADVVLFVTDVREGLTPADREVADFLRRDGSPVIHLVNKADTQELAHEAVASSCGFDPLIAVSVEHSRGLGDLYEALAARIPEGEPAFGGEADAEDERAALARVAVVGRPNVGKSTLINRLLGEERLVVSDIPGTTRDAIDSLVRYRGGGYVFIDTAGIRRRGRIERGVEQASVHRTEGALRRAEVAVLMMDATEGVTDLDTKIAGLVLKSHRGCVLAVNKWDEHKGDDEVRKRLRADLSRQYPFLAWAPVVFTSGLSGHNIGRMFSAIDRVVAAFRRRIPTGELNRAVEELVARHPPPLRHHRPVRIYYATQIGAAPPRIVLFSNRPEGLEKGYLRYLENGLREAFDFSGTPLSIQARHRNREKREAKDPARIKKKYRPGKKKRG